MAVNPIIGTIISYHIIFYLVKQGYVMAAIADVDLLLLQYMTRPQHRELRPLLFANSEWVL